MNKVKKTLIEMSNEQEIHDLKDDILNNVDTSKVSRKQTIMKVSRGSFVPKLMIFAGCVSLSIIGIAALLNSKNKTNNHNNLKPIPTENSSESETIETNSNEDTTIYSEDISIYSNDYLDIEEKFAEAVSKDLLLDYQEIQITEKNSIINIFDSLKNLNLIKTNSESEYSLKEEALVNELYFYIENIENMIGINSNDTSSNMIIDNEELIESNNSKLKIEGRVYNNKNTISFSGTKEIINDNLIYSIEFNYNDYIININEKFGKPDTKESKKTNKFEYVFKNELGEVIDNFNVTQTIKTDDSTKITKFTNDNFVINSIKVDGTSINCGFEKSDEKLSITKIESGYVFSFKLSSNSYTR